MWKVKAESIIRRIKPNTTNVYTPLIEAIVNSIQAIEDRWNEDGEIIITLTREGQWVLSLDDEAIPEIVSIAIEDNWIWFNPVNIESFDELYSELKIERWCKGFWRFMFLKYFDTVKIESNYQDWTEYKSTRFDFWRWEDFVENQIISAATKDMSWTILYLNNLREWKFEKKLSTIARRIVDKLLIYFINDDYKCPTIRIVDGWNEEILNDYINTHKEITLVDTKNIILNSSEESEEFNIKIFKNYYPDNRKSKIILSAHNREVTDRSISEYIPEFSENFFEEIQNDKGENVKVDYFVRVYISGDYLNRNVTDDRGEFKFADKNEMFLQFSSEDIEIEASKIIKSYFSSDVHSRSEKKIAQIKTYVEKEAPYYSDYLKDLDYSNIPYNLDNTKIEMELHRAKYEQEKDVKIWMQQILNSENGEINEKTEEIFLKLSKSKKSDLAKYVTSRKVIIDYFMKLLELQYSWKYSSENAVHNMIFPIRSSSDDTSYFEHNLWLLDERLSFTQYILSDKPLDWKNGDRTDILVFDNPMIYRWENEASNPITVFEFKRPGRDDFTNKSEEEDPIDQIIRYVMKVKAWECTNTNGRQIITGTNTPFFWYLICDLTPKVKDWLVLKNYNIMPDAQWYFYWHSTLNLYIEVLSWDKVLKDAKMRNWVFFDALWI